MVFIGDLEKRRRKRIEEKKERVPFSIRAQGKEVGMKRLGDQGIASSKSWEEGKKR